MATATTVEVESGLPSGLSSEEAKRRLAEFGPNEPARPRRGSAIGRVLLLLINPLALLLLIAAGFSALLGQAVDAAIIAVVVALGATLNFVQTYRSERAIEALRQRVRSTASVLRDGNWQEVPRSTVVPGDVVRLLAGYLVPADALLLKSKDLYVQQAALTGESMPVEKDVAAEKLPTDDPEAACMVFLGTSVVSGYGIASVSVTGSQTVFGGIAQRLADRPQETEVFADGDKLKLRKYAVTRTVFSGPEPETFTALYEVTPAHRCGAASADDN